MNQSIEAPDPRRQPPTRSGCHRPAPAPPPKDQTRASPSVPGLPRRCRNGHLMLRDNTTPNGRCRRCRTLATYRHYARRHGLPLCRKGHGLVFGGVAPDGSCTECAAPPVSPTPPAPPDTWLDWALVDQVLKGRKPVRPLTMHEMLCLIGTVCRRNDWDRSTACVWIRQNTQVTPPRDNGDHLIYRWARRNALPQLTIADALTWENPPDHDIEAWAGLRQPAASDEAA